MAWYSEKSVFTTGKYKGKKVSEVDDASYINWLHHSKLNVFFTQEVLDRLKTEGLDLSPSVIPLWIRMLSNEKFIQFVRPPGSRPQDSLSPYRSNKPLLTPKGKEYLERWRNEYDLFNKILTDSTQKELVLEEYLILQQIIQLGFWKDACVKIGGILEYLLIKWFQNKKISPDEVIGKKVRKWKAVKFYQLIEYYMNNSRKFEDEIGSYTDWNLVKNILKDYRNYIHLEKYELRVRQGNFLKRKEFERIYPIYQDIIKKF